MNATGSLFMHCRIRVADYATWKSKMDSDNDSQLRAGLTLRHLWRGVDDPNLAFMILEVRDKEKARQHLNPGDVTKSSEVAGVLEFDWRFVENVSVQRA